MDPAEAVLTWRDLAAASRHRAIRSRVWALLVPVCLFLLLVAAISPWATLRIMAGLLVVYVATVPLWGPTMATWLQARRRSWPDSPTTWAVMDVGMAVTNERGEKTLPWNTCTDVTSWRRGVSLTYGRAVAFIPDRGFSDEAHRRAFVDAARRLVTQGSG